MSTTDEIIVPIIIKDVTVSTDMGLIHRLNVHYVNTLVKNQSAIVYVPVEGTPDNYIRKTAIQRDNREDVTWPDHPRNVNGKIQGGIAVINSLDNKILLVRNHRLWGLPKGARNYTEYTDLKHITDKHYRQTGEIYQHNSVAFATAETSLENICRETLEETGIIIDPSLLHPLNFSHRISSYCAYDAYHYEYPHPAVQHLKDLQANGTDHENDELLWVTRADLKEMLVKHRKPYCSKVFNHITFWLLEKLGYDSSLAEA